MAATNSNVGRGLSTGKSLNPIALPKVPTSKNGLIAAGVGIAKDPQAALRQVKSAIDFIKNFDPKAWLKRNQWVLRTIAAAIALAILNKNRPVVQPVADHSEEISWEPLTLEAPFTSDDTTPQAVPQPNNTAFVNSEVSKRKATEKPNPQTKQKLRIANLTELLGVLEKRNGPIQNCRFIARIFAPDKVNQSKYMKEWVPENFITFERDLAVLCQTATEPGKTLVTQNFRAYGPVLKIPFSFGIQDCTIEIVGTQLGYFERRYFDAWQAFIVDYRTFNAEYKTNYAGTVQILRYDNTGKFLYGFQLVNAYPSSIGDVQLDHGSDELGKLSVTFTYDYWLPISVRESGNGAEILITDTRDTKQVGEIPGGIGERRFNDFVIPGNT